METSQYYGLHNLIAPWGARQAKKRLGRGEGSGLGKTSGKGNKGQKARKSGNVRPGFEGGQNPLTRRLPKVGFSNYPFRKEVCAINLGRINEMFEGGTRVDLPSLYAAGLIRTATAKVKILSGGEITKPLKFHVNAASDEAIKKIKSAGGEVDLIVTEKKSYKKSRK
jgi:large subunit ribosomal protein L15